LAVEPTGMLATVHSAGSPATAGGVQVKPTVVLSLKETKVVFAGRVSETFTLAAGFGPALVTKISKMLLEPAPTEVLCVGADWLS
jgi:hypothetical protein